MVILEYLQLQGKSRKRNSIHTSAYYKLMDIFPNYIQAKEHIRENLTKNIDVNYGQQNI